MNQRKDGFTVRVQGGIAYWDGSTSVVQHKGAATRMAKTAGAKEPAVAKVEKATAKTAKVTAKTEKAPARAKAKAKQPEEPAKTAKAEPATATAEPVAAAEPVATKQTETTPA